MVDGNGSAGRELELAPWTVEQARAARSLTRLPSGMVVRLRPVSAVDLALAGELPEPLTVHVFEDMPELEARAETEADRARLRLEKVRAVNAVCCAVIAEPRVVADSGAPESGGALLVSELSWRDRMHVFAIACGLVEASLARFPAEPSGGVEAAPGGAGILDAAELNPRPAAG